MKLETLDRVFSDYIRERDTSDNGYGTCISCGKIIHRSNADAGHYFVRHHMSLRFDERNVNMQCRECNRENDGNPKGYAMGLIKRYGPDILNELTLLKNSTQKFSQREIDDLVKYYRKKIKELR